MKVISIALFLILNVFTIEQNDTPIYVEGKCYKGYIFLESTKSHMLDSSFERFTPTKEDVASLESKLKKRIKGINKNEPNQGNGCPIIHRKLNKYNRQYLGYINENGHKVIWVNFIWKKSCPQNWSKEIVTILDGCSHYWNIDFDVEKDSFSEIKVNGRG
ncbi:hypothetical protein [Zunongwangia pacifica]|uniref:Uncharacterized protein n=1 Tax=Zunongwangia pacifica TaxID=2911062 RepID=A0A9X1ZVT2_9FLAO|nr:hypothetical protein [Zunongwangia pacifica]MCL6220839.1 hypothetical protein [Zunongwangia pacifica]